MPDKNLGQHWLRDVSLLDAVVRAADVSESTPVLEIGPGLGTLTARLHRAGARLTSVEYDASLYVNLTVSFAHSGITFIRGDILAFDETTMPPEYHVAGNVPYYITAPILKKFIQSTQPPRVMGLLLQQEVAQRIAASPGDLSVLAISVQNRYDPVLCDVVPARYFEPPPRVNSQIISLRLRDTPRISDEEAQFMPIVRAAFANKRKTLMNSLGTLQSIDRAVVAQFLEDNGLALSVRAQELSLEQWASLCASIHKECI